MKKFAFIIICLFLLNSTQFAQDNSARIAFYSKNSFYDDKTGVKKLVKTEKLLYDCDFSMQPLLDNIRKVEGELKSTSISNEQRKLIEKEYEIVKTELNTHKNNRIDHFETRKKVILQPILNEVDKAIDILEKENNVIFVDLDELTENGFLLSFDESFDLSKSIISFINNYLDKKDDSIPKLNITEVKFAKINTETFYDEISGIKELFEATKELNNSLKTRFGENPTKAEIDSFMKPHRNNPIGQIYQKIGKELENIRQEKSLTFIIDSSKEIPNRFKDLPSDDLTKEFIIRYNQKNQ